MGKAKAAADDLNSGVLNKSDGQLRGKGNKQEEGKSSVKRTRRGKNKSIQRVSLETSEDSFSSVAQEAPVLDSGNWLVVLRRLVRECVMLLLFTIAFYFLIVLVSYHPADPGFNRVGEHVFVENKGGRLGAFLADFLLTLVGYLAYIIPTLLMLRAARLFRSRGEPVPFKGLLFMLRCLGLALVITAASALASLFLSVLTPLPVSAGGILGDTIATRSVSLLSTLGATLIWVSLLLVGFTLLFDVVWSKVFLVSTAVLSKLCRRGVSMLSRLVGDGWRHYQDREKNQSQFVIDPGFIDTNKTDVPILSRPTELLESSSEQGLKKLLPSVLTPAKKKSVKPKVKSPRKLMSISEGDLPSVELLDVSDAGDGKGFSEGVLNEMSQTLEEKLKDFNIQAQVEAVLPGPVVTRFELQLAPGTKVSRITNLAKDLARSLAVISVRVVEVIPGKTVIGVEIPNAEREIIRLSEVLISRAYEDSKSPLTLSLGKDIAGYSVVVDLAKMPHLLVAGTTGSGKSVGLNAMLISMLMKATPDDLRLIMIDPKMLELSVYDDIPHLLAPVVTDMKEAANALRWCVAEMERRYRLMAALGVRNIGGYNKKVQAAIEVGEPLVDPLFKPEVHTLGDETMQTPTLEPLPFIVVVIDEFADMMMIVGKKVEELIARIAQKARAAGIHLVLATQRPSVDVITGLIKANVPSRIAFQVSSKVDSRTILDQGGAEQLLGHGDMLYLPPGTALPVRVHGAFVSDDEVHRVCDDWRARAEPDYLEDVLEGGSGEGAGAYIPGIDEAQSDESDPLYDQAVEFVTQTRKVSISSVQRKLKIGYNRAARIVESMELAGVVSQTLPNGSREVIAPPPVEI